MQRRDILEALEVRLAPGREEVIGSLAHRQKNAVLRKKLNSIHSADCARVMEMLPIEKRQAVWSQLDEAKASKVPVELGTPARHWATENTKLEYL